MVQASVLLLAETWALVVLAVTLVAASYTDVRRGKILNVVTYPAVALGLIGHTLAGGLTGSEYSPLGLVGALTGLAAGFLPLLLIWRAGGIGGGDAKLMAAVGALTGWEFTLSALFYGLIFAAVMAFVLMIRRGIVVRTFRRIGRFLWLTLCRAKPGDVVTADSPKVPFGLALCLGAAAHMVDYLLGGPVSRHLQ
jgi:prepilin peptidase CpaA